MGSQPLPALAIRPPEQQNPLEMYAHAMAIKGQQQQQQIQQQEIQENRQKIKNIAATTKAYQDWDANTGDYNDLTKKVIANGGDATAAMAVSQHGVTLMKTLSDMHATDAATKSKNVETFLAKQKAVGDQLQGIESVPDAQLHDTVLSKINDLTQGGILDAPHAQQLTQQIQSTQDPAVLRANIHQVAQNALGAKAVAEQVKEKAATDKDTAQTAEATSATAKNNAETQNLLQGMSPALMESKYVKLMQAKNMGTVLPPGDAAFVKAYEHQKTLVPVANFNLQNAGTTGAAGKPSAMAEAVAGGTMKWNDVISPRTPMSVKNAFAAEVNALNPNFDTSTYAIQTKAAEKATSGTWADQRVAYNTAIDHSQQLLDTVDALNNGDTKKLNSLKNFFKTEFGSPDVPKFDAVANAYNHEVTSVVSKGHITDAEVATGHATLPDNASPQQIRGVVAAYKQLMSSKRDELDKVIKAGSGNKANAVLGVQSGTQPPAAGTDFWNQFPEHK